MGRYATRYYSFINSKVSQIGRPSSLSNCQVYLLILPSCLTLPIARQGWLGAYLRFHANGARANIRLANTPSIRASSSIPVGVLVGVAPYATSKA